MQYLCALAFKETTTAKIVKEWLQTDLFILKEKRHNYIVSKLYDNKDLSLNNDWLKELSLVRKQYETLSDDNGPYHIEVFPCDYASPEDALLGVPAAELFFKDKTISPFTEDLLVAISVSQWG